MLDPRRLRILHRLAEHGTVAAAAESLHLTGPAVSQHLAALEREAGTPLLEKQGRGLVLTPAGRLLVSHAEVILDDLSSAESALASFTARGTGTVRVAAFPSAARCLVPPAWVALRDAPEPVALRLVEHEPEESLTALARREVDIAVAHSYSLLPRALPTRCDERWLMDDPVLLAVPRSVAGARGLAPGQPVPLADFRAEAWLVPGRSESCHEMIQRACGAAGFVPDAVAEATDFAVLIALVAAGAGVALVPRMALPYGVEGPGVDGPGVEGPGGEGPGGEGPGGEQPGGDGRHGQGLVSLHPLVQPVVRRVSALTRTGATRRPDIAHALDALANAAHPPTTI
jgi:DNA-binding transcriptional LysR family regulator